MSEINDDELGRVPDAEIWELFTGHKEPAAVLENGQFRLIHPITQGEFEVIRDTVSHSVSVFCNPEHLLHLMWIRESKFGKLPLHDDNLLTFFASVFTICDDEVSAEEIWQFGIGELMNFGFVERKDTKLGKKRAKSYHLSIAGRKRAEKWFDRQIRKTGQINDAPYLPEKRLQKAIALTPPSVALETVDEPQKTVAEQEDILDLYEKMKDQGRWVSQDDFVNKDINSNRNTYSIKTLQVYRESCNVVWLLKDQTIGRDKVGNFFKRTGNNRYNYRYRYFLLREHDKTITSNIPESK